MPLHPLFSCFLISVFLASLARYWNSPSPEQMPTSPIVDYRFSPQCFQLFRTRHNGGTIVQYQTPNRLEAAWPGMHERQVSRHYSRKISWRISLQWKLASNVTTKWRWLKQEVNRLTYQKVTVRYVNRFVDKEALIYYYETNFNFANWETKMILFSFCIR